MLDHFNVKAPAGFPDHPHRGFETVTYVLKGQVRHDDFTGHGGTIGPGDLQWMTAGRGIVHSEMPIGSEACVGLQLWVNLPKSAKMMEPRYQELVSKDIPHVSYMGVEATVIAGTAFNTTSPVYTINPVTYLDFKMAPHSTLVQPIPAGFNAFIFSLEGEAHYGAPVDTIPAGYFEGEGAEAAAVAADGGSAVAEGGAAVAKPGGTLSGPHYTLLLSNDGTEEGVVVHAGAAGARFVLIAGKPIGEKVVQYGPFVMTSEAEIRATFEDYELGRNGFENARTWRSPMRR